MVEKTNRLPFKGFTLRKVVVLAFTLISMMVLLLGVVSFVGIHRLNMASEHNQHSYKTMMQLQTVQDSMKEMDAEILNYFSGNGWKSVSTDGAISIFQIEDEQMKIDISKTGLLPWSVQLNQRPLALERGKKYAVTFEAKSTVPRRLEVILENSVNYTRYYVRSINLKSEMTKHTLFFEMKESTDILAQIMFSLGNFREDSLDIRHYIYIDNVSVIELESGKELIKNGEFQAVDIEKKLSDANRLVRNAIVTASELTSGHAEQQELLREFELLFEEWHTSNVELVHHLSRQLRSSGHLSISLDFQSRDSIITLSQEMESIIERLEAIEEEKLSQREQQTERFEITVYTALGLTLLLSILVAVGTYFYFSRYIIKPITYTSSILREMVGQETAATRDFKDLDLQVNASSEEINRLHHHITEYIKLLHNEAQIDGLTGLANRRSFNNIIEEYVKRQRDFILILIDVDHFKTINDTWGHLAGDEVIRSLASIMLKETSNDDQCFRYGGEEFGVLMTGKDMQTAYDTAEHIRKAFTEMKQAVDVTVTLSAGIAEYRPGERSEMVIQRADNALYQSKAAGRNRTTISSNR